MFPQPTRKDLADVRSAHFESRRDALLRPSLVDESPHRGHVHVSELGVPACLSAVHLWFSREPVAMPALPVSIGDVVGLSAGPYVNRVAARRRIARVESGHAGRERLAIVEFPRELLGSPHLVAKPCPAVPVLVAARSPRPAFARATYGYLGPERRLGFFFAKMMRWHDRHCATTPTGNQS